MDPNFAEAYNNRCIAKQLVGEDGKDDGDMADDLTKNNLEAQKRLQQQRKWMCVGYNARGEPEGMTSAKNADFLISFASDDRKVNNEILQKLKTGVCYNGEIRPLPTTDKLFLVHF